jgi:hypothetical protein
MSVILKKNQKPTKKEIEMMSYQYGSYIKVVVDIEKQILCGGGAMHYDDEQLLLESGCKQENLWGGGIDLETGEVTYDSMINIRPDQGNFKREIQSEAIQKRFKSVVEEVFKNESGS